MGGALENEDSGVATHYAVIRVYDETGTAMETHEYAGEVKEP